MSFEMKYDQTVQIKLEKIDDIKDFVTTSNQYDFKITISSGEYVVDAKSMVEVFSLELNENLKLTAHTSEKTDFFDKIKKYIANNPEQKN